MKPNNPRYHTAIKKPQNFYLYFGPYGIGVSRPILRERATFGTLNQLVSESGKPPIPHGLVVRIRAFHARGRGSIPRGGDIRQFSANINFFRPLFLTGGFDSRAGEHQCLADRIKNRLPVTTIFAAVAQW